MLKLNPFIAHGLEKEMTPWEALKRFAADIRSRLFWLPEILSGFLLAAMAAFPLTIILIVVLNIVAALHLLTAVEVNSPYRALVCWLAVTLLMLDEID
jgi:uncharacterized membrane protein